MTSVSPVSGFQQSTSTSRKTIADNFDTFLSLLTTQLQNQSPLDPMDTNQFTQQLVQFSQVEQQIKSNEMLTALLQSANASNTASAASYLGAEVTADGSTAPFTEGRAQWAWTAPRAADTATITIANSRGETVWQQTQAIAAGAGDFRWDGRTLNGGFVTSGDYSIRIDAREASGRPVPISTELRGTVNQVDISGNTIKLRVGNSEIPLDRVKSLRKGE